MTTKHFICDYRHILRQIKIINPFFLIKSEWRLQEKSIFSQDYYDLPNVPSHLLNNCFNSHSSFALHILFLFFSYFFIQIIRSFCRASCGAKIFNNSSTMPG